MLVAAAAAGTGHAVEARFETMRMVHAHGRKTCMSRACAAHSPHNANLGGSSPVRIIANGTAPEDGFTGAGRAAQTVSSRCPGPKGCYTTGT